MQVGVWELSWWAYIQVGMWICAMAGGCGSRGGGADTSTKPIESKHKTKTSQLKKTKPRQQAKPSQGQAPSQAKVKAKVEVEKSRPYLARPPPGYSIVFNARALIAACD